MDAQTHTDPQTKPRFLRSRGIRIPPHPQLIQGKIRRLLRTDQYERKECAAVLRVLNKDDVVIELGAGIGYMSTLMSTKNRAREVHAFEANPTLLDYIATLHQANNVTNVTVHNALLAPQDADPVDFYVREDFLASSMERDNADGIVSVEKIEVRNINSVLDQIKPTALVCDIEGAEAGLLPGADLSCLRAAVIELHPQWIGQDGVQKVFDAMHRAGLTYFPRASEGKVVTFLKGW